MARLLVERILEEEQAKKPDPKGRMDWELSGRELRERVVARSSIATLEGAAEYRVVVDATYSREDAQLFEICNVWGYADPGWSPLVLRLSLLREVDRPKGRNTPVEEFEPEQECGESTDFVHEFLYLRHGHQQGCPRSVKNWGLMGYTNAALLWPPHLEHLLGKIGFKRVDEVSGSATRRA